MTLTEYQNLAERTLISRREEPLDDEQTMIAWNAIGLAGEAGEVCEIIKKGIFHDHGVDRAKLAKELGDVLWYLSSLATEFGLSLSGIAEGNIEKLLQRYPEGYTRESSMSRRDEDIAARRVKEG